MVKTDRLNAVRVLVFGSRHTSIATAINEALKSDVARKAMAR
jgi:hypothetical protein